MVESLNGDDVCNVDVEQKTAGGHDVRMHTNNMDPQRVGPIPGLKN
jgi:hypothetical protein